MNHETVAGANVSLEPNDAVPPPYGRRTCVRANFLVKPMLLLLAPTRLVGATLLLQPSGIVPRWAKLAKKTTEDLPAGA